MEKMLSQADVSLGIIELDTAHKVLTQEIMSIMNLPNFEFSRRLPHLVELLERDFRIEEDLMEAIDYPELCTHREQHATLLAAMHHTVAKALNGDYLLPRQVLNILGQWLLSHLIKADAPFVKALRDAGARPINHFGFNQKKIFERSSRRIEHVR